jgi:hypothetical protein
VVTFHAVRVAQSKGSAWTPDLGLGVEVSSDLPSDDPTGEVQGVEALISRRHLVQFIANSRVALRSDFVEGVECAVGSKKGTNPVMAKRIDQPPPMLFSGASCVNPVDATVLMCKVWAHEDWEAAAMDAEVREIVEAIDGKTSVRTFFT